VRGIGRSLLGVVFATAVIAVLAADTLLAVHIHSEKAIFQVLISPGRAGSDDFVLQLMDGGGALLPVKAATLVLSKPGSGAGPPGASGELGE
jgi:copper transport protein